MGTERKGTEMYEGMARITITIEGYISPDDVREIQRASYYGNIGRAIQNLVTDPETEITIEEGVE